MTQYLDWKVGDRVVCVSLVPIYMKQTGLMSLFRKHRVSRYQLEIGKEYTLSEVTVGSHIITGEEVVGVRVRGDDESIPGWIVASRFRKVQPRKTSIAVFERLLLTQNNEVETA